MIGCKTDCVEKPVSRAFEQLGRRTGKNPWWFLMIPSVLSAGLTGGFYFLQESESKGSGIEYQFTPVNGLAKEERRIVKSYFPLDENHFSPQRQVTEGIYGALIFTNTTDILTDHAFNEINELNDKVLRMQVENQNFSNLCALTRGACWSNPVLDVVKETAGYGSKLTYPVYEGVFLGSGIGGVRLLPKTNQVESAEAIRLFYFLREDNETLNNLWLTEFIATASEMKGKEVDVSYFTSLSREEEFERSSESIIPFFSVTYTLVINFSIFSCMRLDCVRNKVWVAAFGVLSAGLAVTSGFGLLLYCGMPFTMTVAMGPFLILGIGVDDMFIMLSCWQRTRVEATVEDRMAATYKEAAVSITITTLTDALAFYIGCLTPFPSVQSFCVYTGTAVVFCYLYNITFFGAFLALNGRREKSNRHWFTCVPVPQPQSEKYNVCCVGGAFDRHTGQEEPLPINRFIENYYGPFLTNKYTKAFVVLLYAGYLAVGIYGCTTIKEGIDLKNLAPDDSYVGEYYEDEDVYFSEYGPSVMVVVTDEHFHYWDEGARAQLDTCLKAFGSLTVENRLMVDLNLTVSWLHAYLSYGQRTSLDLDKRENFFNNLTAFFDESPETYQFKQDVNFSSPPGIIYASRLFVQTVNIRTSTDEKQLLNKFRETAKSEACPGSIVVYHPAFVFFDQYAAIVTNTIQNVVVATLAILAVSFLLIPNPVCSFWVTFAIASVIVTVAGFMALWDIRLDSISMIILIISIGFSVDFSAHISYGFVSSSGASGNEKAIDAVTSLGFPIIQGAVSTIVGVVVLSMSVSYIFRTFCKIMFMVISFGAVHGILFLPVFLTFYEVCDWSNEKDRVGPGVSDSSDHITVDKVSLKDRVSVFSTGVATQPPDRKPYEGMYNTGFDPDCP